MKRRARIAVDLDGVLAETMVAFCRILNERHSTKLRVESFVRWSAWEIAGITKDEFFRTLDEAWFDWKRIPPTEDDLFEKMAQLKKFGEVDIVTGRSMNTVSYARAWLRHHSIPHDSFVRTESTNAKVNLDYDLFIDDSADLMSLLASSLDRYGILYLRPWNRYAPNMPRIFKAKQWDEIPELTQKIIQRKYGRLGTHSP